jgi:hypothetical protein
MARPLGSTPITGASLLLRAGPPADPATVLSALRLRPLGALPAATRTMRAAVSGPAFPRSAQEPQTGLASPTCRAPPGQSAGSRQAHPATFRSSQFRCRLWTFDTSAAIRLRSPSRSPPDTLPGAFSPTLTTLDDQPSAARGGLEPPPQGGSGGPAILHLSRSTTASKVSYLSNLPSCARGATGMSTYRCPAVPSTQSRIQCWNAHTSLV